jgi:adenosylcobinamide-phosphate synthase
MSRAIGVALGLAADRWLGEPPTRWHPVAWFGTAMGALERAMWRDGRAAGAAYAAVGVGGAWLVGVGLRRVIGPGPAAAVATAVAVAGRMLDDEGAAVARLLADGDVGGARLRVRSLVGRTTADLDEAGIARAVVESIAENTTDAVVAPALWAAFAGAPAVLAYRVANTLDAMVGHHSDRYERFGWASARLDDVLGVVPARVGAVAVAMRHPTRARAVVRAVMFDARRHPSPNAGVIEAAFAASLGIGLGGANRYGDRVEERGRLGDGPDPAVADISRAIRLRRDVTVIVGAGILTVAVVSRGPAAGRSGGPTRRWRRSAR